MNSDDSTATTMGPVVAIISHDCVGGGDRCSTSPLASPSSLDVAAGVNDESAAVPPRRRRPRRRGAVVKAALAVMVALLLAVVATAGVSPAAPAWPSPSSSSLSSALAGLPRAPGAAAALSDASAAATETLRTLRIRLSKGAIAAWEESEAAFRELGRTRGSVDHNGTKRFGSLGRAIKGAFRPASSKNGKGERNIRDDSLRKEQRRLRNLKKEATSGEADGPNHYGWMTSFLSSPLAAPLLGFCIVSLLVASLILPRARSRQNAGIVPDETEEEIVEFYERAECGTSLAIPFLEESRAARQSYRRIASDSLLTRQHSRKGQGDVDAYYSRVLCTLSYNDDDDGNNDENDANSRDEAGNVPLVQLVNKSQQSDQLQIPPSPRSEVSNVEAPAAGSAARGEAGSTEGEFDGGGVSPSQSRTAAELEVPSKLEPQGSPDAGPAITTTPTAGDLHGDHDCITPPRSNLHRDRRNSNGPSIDPEEGILTPRRVSFSPEVGTSASISPDGDLPNKNDEPRGRENRSQLALVVAAAAVAMAGALSSASRAADKTCAAT